MDLAANPTLAVGGQSKSTGHNLDFAVGGSSAFKNNTVGSEPLAGAGSLKNQFLGLINNWQGIKKTAVRLRQAGDLSQVLSGRALQRQSDAVKWLSSNHRYYEMNPKLVVVDRYVELIPGRKFAVFARVKEDSKLIEDATGQVLKSSEDTYNVNYTIEKIKNSWFITDSSIVASGSAGNTQAGKTNR